MLPTQSLLDAIAHEVHEIRVSRKAELLRARLNALLMAGARQALLEIKIGADRGDFHELAVLNFISRASTLGYPPTLISAFLTTVRPTLNAAD